MFKVSSKHYYDSFQKEGKRTAEKKRVEKKRKITKAHSTLENPQKKKNEINSKQKAGKKGVSNSSILNFKYPLETVK